MAFLRRSPTLCCHINLFLNSGKLRQTCRDLSQETQWLKQAGKEKTSQKGETKHWYLSCWTDIVKWICSIHRRLIYVSQALRILCVPRFWIDRWMLPSHVCVTFGTTLWTEGPAPPCLEHVPMSTVNSLLNMDDPSWFSRWVRKKYWEFFFDRCKAIGAENWSLQGISLAPKEPFGFQPLAFCHQLHPIPAVAHPGKEHKSLSWWISTHNSSPTLVGFGVGFWYFLQFVCPAQNQLQTFPLESCLRMAAWPSSGVFSCHLVPYLIFSCWSLKWQCLVFL